jgi:nitroimidazol reductase NimA-like FMN-containing flavoprotein (pyridoxamine 5'-phosphate oxidase superfamily)
MRTSFSEKEKQFLQTERVARFNSLTQSGRIHAVPICYAFDGTSFFFHALGDRKRWRDLPKNDGVSVEVDYYSDDWSKLKGVLVYGKASILSSGTDHDKGVKLLREKYAQYQTVLTDDTRIVSVPASDIVSWNLS